MTTQLPALNAVVQTPAVHYVRGAPVVLDADVARVFGVQTERLTEQIRRNRDRFGDDFAFLTTAEEWGALIPQTAGSRTHGGRRKPPWALTEHGVVMAATVLKSPQAAAATRLVIEAFVAARRASPAGVESRALTVIDAAGLPIVGGEGRPGLLARLNDALGRTLDAIADPQANTTVRDEVRLIAAEGLNAIKAHLQTAGVQNEHTLAEVRKLLAEADALEAKTLGRHIENRHRELALTAKQLRIAIELHRSLESGSVETLLATLREMEGA